MERGGHGLTLFLALTAAGCAASDGKLEIRAKDPAAALRTGSDSLESARAQLALGNVGLALEGFRKAARERPDSPEPLRGIAACYEAMGRYDVARTNYEAALALAPRDPGLLKGFAGSLEQQGQVAQAKQVRAEAVTVAALHPSISSPPSLSTKASPGIAAPAKAALPRPIVTPPVEARAARPTPKINMAPATPPANLAEVVAAPSSTITVTLPPPRPVQPKEVVLPATTSPKLALTARKPKLERMSPGEVALLTGDKPAWRAVVVAQDRQSTTVRFVPLRTAARPNIRLLNAARRQGLAAATRDYLVERGWRRIDVGDAPQPRDRSVVYYPSNQATIGRRLAAQFGFQSQAAKDAREFLVLLGRDARPARSRTRG